MREQERGKLGLILAGIVLFPVAWVISKIKGVFGR